MHGIVFVKTQTNKISPTRCSILLCALKTLLHYFTSLFAKSRWLFPIIHHLPTITNGLQSAAGPTQTLPTLKPEQSWAEKEPENISITHLKVPLSTMLTVLWFKFPFDVSLYRQHFPSESRTYWKKVNMSYQSCQACLCLEG